MVSSYYPTQIKDKDTHFKKLTNLRFFLLCLNLWQGLKIDADFQSDSG